MQEKQVGAGSLWNPGNWHWESKNYTEVCKELLSQKIRKVRLEKDGIKLENSDIKSIEGEAEINIRKSKQIFCYEFTVEVEWTAISSDDVAEGTYIIRDINPFDTDYDVENVKADEVSSISEKSRNIIKKHMKQEYVEFLKNFMLEIMEKEADPEKLKQIQQQREVDNQKTQAARDQNGQVKDQIFHDQKQKELEFKMKNMELANQQQQ